MIEADALIAVDWGTTNRRAYRLQRDGVIADSFADDRGAQALTRGDYPAEIAALRARWGDLPVIITGMAGSTRGWVEAPYARCPAGLAELRACLHWVEAGRTAIIPGVAIPDDARPDVMRGEEVQALGAVASGLAPPTGLLCHPGTHNKWVRMQDGRIDSFTTAMTGELYALMAEHSLIAPEMRSPAHAGAAFAAGVRAAYAGTDLLTGLFRVRARAALHRSDSDESSWVSGLLIGSDIRAAVAGGPDAIEDVSITGTPVLAALYAAALAIGGRNARVLDVTRCVIAGITAIAWDAA